MLKSTCAAGAGFNAAPVVINEQRVVGSRCGPFETALEMLATEGGIDVERYISGDSAGRILESKSICNGVWELLQGPQKLVLKCLLSRESVLPRLGLGFLWHIVHGM